ncbi:MAG: Dabb family protein [Lachnospiraceae bacterium]|nr:Dabb family protein [Lachnospiraceae bacterium]MDE6698538.1 Dabb family protein [Lachnospiraceae bacterium]
MVRHIILWKIKEDIDETEKQKIKLEVKENLEGLLGEIDGLKEIKVQTDALSSSNADLMLNSLFDSEEALKAYAVHPAHVKVADENVRPFMQVRMCLDFKE